MYIVSAGAPLNGKDSVYGSGEGLIALDNVICTGNEINLLQCSHNGITKNNCDHAEDAAVICGSEFIICCCFLSLKRL